MAMQILLSLRLLSKNHSTNSFVSLAKTQKATDNLVSKYSTTALSGSWVKPHSGSCFLANPVLVNKFLHKSNALMKAPSKGLLDFKRVFSRRYSGQESSHFSSSFNYFFHFREWLQRTNPYCWLLGLTAANFAIYLVWKKADHGYMMKNFMVSVDNLKSGRVHTLITSAFSHMNLVHMLSNMAAFTYFGQIGDSFVSGLSHLGGAAVAVIMWARYRRCFY